LLVLCAKLESFVSVRYGRASEVDEEKERNSTRDGNARSYNCRAKCLHDIGSKVIPREARKTREIAVQSILS